MNRFFHTTRQARTESNKSEPTGYFREVLLEANELWKNSTDAESYKKNVMNLYVRVEAATDQRQEDKEVALLFLAIHMESINFIEKMQIF